MKSTITVLSLLAASIVAQPHKHAHQQRHKLNARNQEVKWVTDWVYETEVVAVTETVWVSEGFVPPPTTSPPSSTTTRVPAQFFQPASKVKSSTAPKSSAKPTTSVYVAPPVPTTSTSIVVPTTTKAPEKAPEPKVPEPVVSTSTTTTPSPSPVVTPERKPQPAYSPPAYTPPAEPSTTTAPAVAPSTPSGSSGSGSYGGACSEGSPCKGDITYYEAGMGACGFPSDGSKEDVVALPHGLMGTQSNGNPFCGRKVTVTLNGKSIVCDVVDKCMGCEMEDLDLSNHAFEQLADFSVGRTTATWHFND